jgi:hypothetical protein
MKVKFKRIAVDIAGYVCLILVPFVGWLPGPGGIPLLLLGLGLLSINNDWAKKMLHYVRQHSESLRDIFFPDKKLIQWAWDIFVILLVITAITIDITTSGIIFRGISIGTLALATTTFMFNRHRLRWLEKIKIKRR